MSGTEGVRDGGEALEAALEGAVLALLEQRSPVATICPSEAARAVGGAQWRPLMEPARAAARRLVARGEVEITQRGRIVDGATAKGPIRIRRAGPARPSDQLGEAVPVAVGRPTSGEVRRR